MSASKSSLKIFFCNENYFATKTEFKFILPDNTRGES